MRGGRDLEGDAVAAVGGGALLPADVPAEERAACGAGALARDLGELGGGRGKLVEIRDGAHEGGETRGGTCETRGCGEVVLADDLQGERGELGERRVGGFELRAEGAKFPETGLCSGA